jgi:hypothetical protein
MPDLIGYPGVNWNLTPITSDYLFTFSEWRYIHHIAFTWLLAHALPGTFDPAT